MKTRYGRAASREFAFVCSVALAGLVLVIVVAFAPWYGAVAVTLAR
jgi:hypothetical protein